MACCPCFPKPSGKRKEVSITAAPSKSVPELTSYRIQVGNNEELQWESSERISNDHILLVNYNVGDHFWQLERAENEFLWSFHVRVNETKLYVTYNDDKTNDQNVTTNDQNVTMQYKADGDVTNERFFKALVRPGGRVLLVSRSLPERILGIKDGVLAMVGIEDMNIHMEWTLAIDLRAPSGEAVTTIVDGLKTADKWISNPAHVGDNITVGQNPQYYLWNLKHNGDVYTIQDTKDHCFVSKGAADDDNDILFENDVSSPSNLREFKTIRIIKTLEILIQNVAKEEYVGSMEGENVHLLKLKEKIIQAKIWRFVQAHMVFIEEDGNRVVFPPLQKDEMKATLQLSHH